MSDVPPAIRILVCDDHPLLRGGVSALLAGYPELELVGEASTGREAIAMIRQLRPDITLMDLEMGDMSGVDVIAIIGAEWPAARIIVLTTYAGDALAQRALAAGARAYLLKSAVRKDLIDTIRAVHAGLKRVQPEIALAMSRYAADDALTAREIQVLRLVAAGNANKRIALMLKISDETVKGHVGKILAKLGVDDRTHAVTVAVQRGFLNPLDRMRSSGSS